MTSSAPAGLSTNRHVEDIADGIDDEVERKVLGNWLLADAEVDLSARKLIVVV